MLGALTARTPGRGRPDAFLCSGGNHLEAASPGWCLLCEHKRIQQVSTVTRVLLDTRQEASLPLHRAKPVPPAPLDPSMHTQLKLQLVNNLTNNCTVSPSEPVRQVGHPWRLGKG